jgi:hypothetical protein
MALSLRVFPFLHLRWLSKIPLSELSLQSNPHIADCYLSSRSCLIVPAVLPLQLNSQVDRGQVSGLSKQSGQVLVVVSDPDPYVF